MDDTTERRETAEAPYSGTADNGAQSLNGETNSPDNGVRSRNGEADSPESGAQSRTGEADSPESGTQFPKDGVHSTNNGTQSPENETAAPESGKIQWHPGFRGAFRREFRKYREFLRFEEELPLTVGSLFVDLLVVELLRPVPMDNELGKIFRRYNVCEYKGPDDSLTIDDCYKTLAYACLYKCSGQTVDAVPAGEITVSLIRDAYPRSLTRALEADGFTVSERWPGVFYVTHPGRADGTGGFPFPVQIIVTSRLPPETHSGLRVLRRPADSADILRFLTEARQESEPGDVANVNAILSASVAANAELYARIRRESDMLYPALAEVMKADLEERWEAGLHEGEKIGWKKGLHEGEKIGWKNGLHEGEKIGWKNGNISGAVAIYRDEMGLDDETITDRISKRFHLTKEQAARYVYQQGA